MVTYAQIIRQLAALVNQVLGEDSTTLEANYAVAPLTLAELKTPYFGLAEMHDAVMSTQGDLVMLIAGTPNHPFRAYFSSFTAPLAHRAQLPSLDRSSKPIIGVLGTVYDYAGSSVGRRCAPKDIDSIDRINNNATVYTPLQYYYAAAENGRIYHTRTTVAIDCCAYSRTDYEAKVASGSDPMPLPDVLENALVCGAAWRLFSKQGTYADVGAPLGQYFSGVAQQLQQGLAATEGFVMPARKMAA